MSATDEIARARTLPSIPHQAPSIASEVDQDARRRIDELSESHGVLLRDVRSDHDTVIVHGADLKTLTANVNALVEAQREEAKRNADERERSEKDRVAAKTARDRDSRMITFGAFSIFGMLAMQILRAMGVLHI